MANPFLANLCRVLCSTTGTGSPLSVGAAVAPWRDLDAAGVANGATVRYGIIDGSLGSEICFGVYDPTLKQLTRVTLASTNAGNAPLNLSGNAQIQITPSAEDFNKEMAFNNVVINGNVCVSQELGTTGATLTNNTAKYIADCWEAMYNHGAATAVVTSAQLAAASFPAVLPGFKFGHQIKATTAITSPANGDFAKHRTKIEGYRIAHLGWGAAAALDIVYAFQFYSTVSGTAFVKFSNSDQSRCYYKEISIATGWNFFAGKIPGDTSGTWQETTSAGLVIEVFSAGKAASPAAPGSWGATNTTQTTNSTNLLGANNNQTILTGLYISGGVQIPASSELAKLMRPFPYELWECSRYYFKTFTYATNPAQNVGTSTGEYIWPATATGTGAQRTPSAPFPRPMRTVPTLIGYNPAAANASARDETLAADCGATGFVAVGEWGYRVAATGNASTAINNLIGLHVTADARL